MGRYLRKLQVLINNTARVITGLGRRCSTFTLMNRLDWLTIKEMVELHSVTMVWKIVNFGMPDYLKGMYEVTGDKSVRMNPPRLQSTADNFRHRGAIIWNVLEDSTRQCETLNMFKKLVKRSILERRAML